MITELKSEMIQVINCIDEKNINDSLLILSKQINLIESIFEYGEIKKEHKISSDTSYLTNQVVPVCNPLNPLLQQAKIHSDMEKLKSSKRNDKYRFERRIRGGFVPEIEAFVPEGVVRKLGLANGDLVYAKKESEIGPNHYKYEVAEKIGNDNLTVRSQFNLCPVEKDGSLWLVKRSQETDGLIKFNNVPYTVLLKKQDVIEHDLQVGDLVDVAFFNSNPKNVKVLWKHTVEEITQQIEVEKKIILLR